MKRHILFMACIIFNCANNNMQANQDQKSQAKKPLTVVETIGIGSGAAVIEIAIDQPLVYFKNSIQQKKNISLDPRAWYRGIVTNIFGMVPVTAAQVTINNKLLHYIKQYHQDVTTTDKIAASVTAGAIAATIASPTELVILQQQNTGQNAYNVLKDIWSQSPAKLFRGFVPTAIRDGGFTTGYMAVSPLIQESAKHYIPNETITTIGSGVSAGVLAAAVTHPWDTIKTRMQASLENPESKSLIKTASTIYNNEGIKGFFKGITARGIRVASALTIIGTVQQKATQYIEKNRKDR